MCVCCIRCSVTYPAVRGGGRPNTKRTRIIDFQYDTRRPTVRKTYLNDRGGAIVLVNMDGEESSPPNEIDSKRKSLVVSRRMLFENIATTTTTTTTKPGTEQTDGGKIARTVLNSEKINDYSRSGNNIIGVNNNCTDNCSDSVVDGKVNDSETEINNVEDSVLEQQREDSVNAVSKPSLNDNHQINKDEGNNDENEEEEENLEGVFDLPELKHLQCNNNNSFYSKRISYNIAVNRNSKINVADSVANVPRGNNETEAATLENLVVNVEEKEESRDEMKNTVPLVLDETKKIEEEKEEDDHDAVNSDNEGINATTTRASDDVVVPTNEEDSTERSDDRCLSVVEDDSAAPAVKDESIRRVAEDLSKSKICENNLSDISSSRNTTADNRVSRENISIEETTCNHSASKSKDCDYPEELNPFNDDEDEGENDDAKSKREKNEISKKNYIVRERSKEVSKNPFDSDSESDENTTPMKSKTSSNPFWSDSEEEEEKMRNESTPAKSSHKMPVPLPRSVEKVVAHTSPQPSPRPRNKDTIQHLSAAKRISPTSSCHSLQTPPRKLSQDSIDVSTFARSSGTQSVNSTLRKKKPAPPPPVSAAVKIINDNDKVRKNCSAEQIISASNNSLNDNIESNVKRTTNVISPWKNRKGPAPARPIPLRRPVKEMPLEDIEMEISDLEIRQQELERQGVQLEQTIREKTESDPENPNAAEESVLQLFELVNEKNELLRRRSELMYMKRMHKLEEEHAEIEYQIRCLMLRPESNKTDSDKAKEEELLRRLLEVVEKRNEIIETMENDRRRETAEDISVTTQLESSIVVPVASGGSDKEKHISKKEKKKNKKEKIKEQEDGKSVHEKHSPSNMIKQKFMTLRHSAKKLHTKIPQ